MEWIEEVEENLGTIFSNKDLLRQALTHRSYIYEKNLPEIQSNEKLEFLGDTILGFIITNLIYHRFPGLSEGDLSKLRARLVNTAMLAEIARELHLGTWLLLGLGEEQSGGREKTSLLANSVEALLGAIFLDQGLEAAREFVLHLFDNRVNVEVSREVSLDFKTRLQELTAKKFGVTPSYSISHEEGPDHRKIFYAEVAVGKAVYGHGKGTSKKEAEQAAAHEALKLLE